MENDTIEEIEFACKTQLQGALNNGANERLEAGIRVSNLQPVSAAYDADWEHPGGVDELDWSVDRVATNHLCVRMIFFPLAHQIERVTFQGIAISRNNILESHYDPLRFVEFVFRTSQYECQRFSLRISEFVAAAFPTIGKRLLGILKNQKEWLLRMIEALFSSVLCSQMD
jgi:hypothetical protein